MIFLELNFLRVLFFSICFYLVLALPFFFFIIKKTYLIMTYFQENKKFANTLLH
jgi:hypothetical protein